MIKIKLIPKNEIGKKIIGEIIKEKGITVVTINNREAIITNRKLDRGFMIMKTILKKKELIIESLQNNAKSMLKEYGATDQDIEVIIYE